MAPTPHHQRIMVMALMAAALAGCTSTFSEHPATTSSATEPTPTLQPGRTITPAPQDLTESADPPDTSLTSAPSIMDPSSNDETPASATGLDHLAPIEVPDTAAYNASDPENVAAVFAVRLYSRDHTLPRRAAAESAAELATPELAGALRDPGERTDPEWNLMTQHGANITVDSIDRNLDTAPEPQDDNDAYVSWTLTTTSSLPELAYTRTVYCTMQRDPGTNTWLVANYSIGG